MSRALPAVSALAICVLAATGCGGSSKTESTNSTSAAAATTATTATTPATSSSASTTPPTATSVTVKVASGKPLTRTQWLAKGDAICLKVNEKLNSSPIRTTADVARIAPQTAAYRQAEIVQLAKLIPPTSKANDWQVFLNGSHEIAQAIAKLGEAAQAGQNITKTNEYKKAQKTQEYVSTISKHDGFKQCSIG